MSFNHPRNLLFILLATALWFNLARAAEEQPCAREPTPRCLIQELVTRIHHEPDAAWLTPSLATQLYFEARQWNISPAVNPLPEQQTLVTQLEQEERFLSHLHAQRWEKAEAMLPDLAATMQDFWDSPPATLVLEERILALQDTHADALKRRYYDSLLSLDSQKRAQRMLAVARHEILGGQPDKGRTTLANTDIDAFSPSEFFQARRTMEWLANRSDRIFLQPDQGLQHCNDVASVNAALLILLSDDLLMILDTLADIPARIDLLLSLARTYHNGAQCRLLTLWLCSQAVSFATQLPFDHTDALLQRILIARTLRRYLQ